MIFIMFCQCTLTNPVVLGLWLACLVSSMKGKRALELLVNCRKSGCIRRLMAQALFFFTNLDSETRVRRKYENTLLSFLRKNIR